MMSDEKTDKLLSPKEVAGYLGIDKNSVLILIRKGLLEGFKLGKKTVRVKKDSLEKFLEYRRMRLSYNSPERKIEDSDKKVEDIMEQIRNPQ